MKKPQYSHQIVVRVPHWLYAAFKADCEYMGVEPSNQLRAILQWWLVLPQKEKGAVDR